MAKKEISYAEAIAEIEDILSRIEHEELDVDELGVKVRRVSVLIRQCRDKLHRTEEEVEKILREMEE